MVVCVRAARCRGMRFGRAKHASWRGGLQALVFVGGGGGVEVEVEGWRRRYSHCTGDGE